MVTDVCGGLGFFFYYVRWFLVVFRVSGEYRWF